MAIYSCNLRSIGRTTHAVGTAGAHIHYIARPSENPTVIAEHISIDPNAARAWMNRQEFNDRANARVCDKIRIALPRELEPEQRIEAVRGYMRELTKGNQAPWYAAFHDTGADAHNPHAHIVVRDRSIETGKRVIGLSDSKRDWVKRGYDSESPTHHVRQKWEEHCNAALQHAGHDVRVDRRSLEDQGIERKPQIHEGPQAQKIESMVQPPVSKIKTTGNGRVINYPEIDQGRTRVEHNAQIIDLNLEKSARSPDFETRVMAQFEKQQRTEDWKVSQWIAERTRVRTREERQIKRDYRSRENRQRDYRDQELNAVKDTLRRLHEDRVGSLHRRQTSESDELRARQSKWSSRLRSVFDLTGKTRAQRKADVADLKAAHSDQRRRLAQTHRDTKERQLTAVSELNRRALDGIKAQKSEALQAVAQRNAEQLIQEDMRLQLREAKREAAHIAVQKQIAAKKREAVAPARKDERVRSSFGVASARKPQNSLSGNNPDHKQPDPSPAPSTDDHKKVRSPKRKPRVKGEKAARLRKAKEAKTAIQKQRGEKIVREDFNPSSTSSTDQPKTCEERGRERDRREAEIREQNKASRDRHWDRQP